MFALNLLRKRIGRAKPQCWSWWEAALARWEQSSSCLRCCFCSPLLYCPGRRWTPLLVDLLSKRVSSSWGKSEKIHFHFHINISYRCRLISSEMLPRCGLVKMVGLRWWALLLLGKGRAFSTSLTAGWMRSRYLVEMWSHVGIWQLHSHCSTGVSSWGGVLLPAEQGGGEGQRQHDQAHQGGQSRSHPNYLKWPERSRGRLWKICGFSWNIFQGLDLEICFD